MGWLSKLMFWRDDSGDTTVADSAIEAVEGYTVDGCFNGPEPEPLEDLASAPAQDGAPHASD